MQAVKLTLHMVQHFPGFRAGDAALPLGAKGAGAVFLTLALYKYRNRGRLWSFCGGFIVGRTYWRKYAPSAGLGNAGPPSPKRHSGRGCFYWDPAPGTTATCP